MTVSIFPFIRRTCAGAVLTVGLVLGMIVATTAAPAAAADLIDKYRLGPGDVIDIVVLEDPAIGRQALVRPDGKITLPLAGVVRAAGRSPEEVAATIRSRLSSNFVEPPSVTVALLSIAPEKEAKAAEEEAALPREIYVLGEVARPGKFNYDPETRINLLQALTLAGGPGPFAARGRIQVREPGADGETVRMVNYEAIEMGAAAEMAPLADGAVIIVPERGFLELD